MCVFSFLYQICRFVSHLSGKQLRQNKEGHLPFNAQLLYSSAAMVGVDVMVSLIAL